MEKEMESGGIKLHYDVTGPEDGPAVLLMHGWGCTHQTVDSIARILAPRMRVYNLDLPGHGLSAEPPSVWGVEDYTRCIEEFIRKEGIKDPVLIGHSFGGRIAILASSRKRYSKIVLVDAAGIKPRRKLSYYIKVYSYKGAKRILPLLLGKEKGEIMLEKWRKKRGSADYAASSPIMRAIMSRCVNEDLKRVMPHIQSSTLLIWGEKDTATPLSDAKTMERLIPDAGLVAFPDAGHYSFLDNPGGFRAVISEFLLKPLPAESNKSPQPKS